MPPQANPKRKRQDEVSLQPAGSLNLIFLVFQQKVSGNAKSNRSKTQEAYEKRGNTQRLFF